MYGALPQFENRIMVNVLLNNDDSISMILVFHEVVIL